MVRMNGGQIIVDYLIQQKVPYLFGLSGYGNIGQALSHRRVYRGRPEPRRGCGSFPAWATSPRPSAAGT